MRTIVKVLILLAEMKPTSLARIRTLLGRGDHRVARDELRPWLERRLSRREVAPVMRVARVLFGADRALRLFHRHVPAHAVELRRISQQEAAEYGICLLDKQFVRNALRFTAGLDRPDRELRLAHAFACLDTHVDDAGSLFDAILAEPDPDSYVEISAGAGRVIALIREGQLEAARERTGRMIEMLERLDHRWGLVYAWGHRAWIDLLDRGGRAARPLARMEHVLARTRMDRPPFCDFVSAAVRRFENGRPAAASLKRRLDAARQWQLLREWDLLGCLHAERPQALARLYYGTPFPGFRRRIERIAANEGWSLPDRYRFVLGRRPAHESIDLATGPANGPALSRCLDALAGDRYAPLTVGDLFHEVFPDDYFCTRTSPGRVHQLCHRLRRAFRQRGSALELHCERGRYRLAAPSAGVRLTIGPGDPVLNGMDTGPRVAITRLRRRVADRRFRVAEARQALGVSRRTTERILSVGLAAGVLERRGATRSVTYRFKQADDAHGRLALCHKRGIGNPASGFP